MSNLFQASNHKNPLGPTKRDPRGNFQFPAISVYVGAKGACQLGQVEKSAGQGGNEGRGDVHIRTVVKG